jgi:hypothetical protein
MDEAGQGIVLSSPPKCEVPVARVGRIDRRIARRGDIESAPVISAPASSCADRAQLRGRHSLTTAPRYRPGRGAFIWHGPLAWAGQTGAARDRYPPGCPTPRDDLATRPGQPRSASRAGQPGGGRKSPPPRFLNFADANMIQNEIKVGSESVRRTIGDVSRPRPRDAPIPPARPIRPALAPLRTPIETSAACRGRRRSGPRVDADSRDSGRRRARDPESRQPAGARRSLPSD